MKAILTYHSIDDSGSLISVARETLQRHIDWLCSAEVPVVSLAEVVDPSCLRGVALTFDDGFENFATEAWPVLREHHCPCTVFVVSDRVGQHNAWDSDDARIPRLPLMDWSTLAELAAGGVEIGGHTRTHPGLPGLTDTALDAEVRGSGQRIADATGNAPTAFAYPFGRHDARTREAVGRAGYTLAVTTEMQLLDSAAPSRLELPRLDAFYLRRPGVLERWGTASFRRFVRLRWGGRRIRGLVARTGLAS